MVNNAFSFTNEYFSQYAYQYAYHLYSLSCWEMQTFVKGIKRLETMSSGCGKLLKTHLSA